MKRGGREEIDVRGENVAREREYKRLARGPWEIYNAGNKPNFPPTKDRWATLDSMSFQSKAMKTITVSTPNQECIGSELMCVETAAKLEQQRSVYCSRRVVGVVPSNRPTVEQGTIVLFLFVISMYNICKSNPHETKSSLVISLLLKSFFHSWRADVDQWHVFIQSFPSTIYLSCTIDRPQLLHTNSAGLLYICLVTTEYGSWYLTIDRYGT